MSTDGDRNISGNPDVYEHNNSSPHSGRSRGGRFPSNSSSRGRGKSGGRSGGRRGGTSKDEHQPITLMRTHSAPPDEHAGIFELGGNGVRANTTSQVLPTRGAPESSDTYELPKTNLNSAETSPRALNNGPHISPVTEKQLDDKLPDTSPTDRPVTLAQPIHMTQPYLHLELQRGYPQPQPSQHMSPNFSTQPRMGQPRPELGDRNKNTPVMQMPLPPQLAHPFQQYYLPPQLHQMQGQMGVPMSPQFLVYPMYNSFPAPGFMPRNPNMMPQGMEHPPRPVHVDHQNYMAHIASQKMTHTPGMPYFPPQSNQAYPGNVEQHYQVPQRSSTAPTEPAKKRTLVLKDKTGKIIVPKDLLESQKGGLIDANLQSSPTLNSGSTFEISNPPASEDLDSLKLLPVGSPEEMRKSDLKSEVSTIGGASMEAQITTGPPELAFATPAANTVIGDLVPSPTNCPANKNLRKDTIGDCRDSDLLDAYTSAPPVKEVSELEPLPLPASTNFSPVPDEGSDDDWETQASKLAEVTETAPQPVVRSLRPGGGEQKVSTNVTSGTVVIVYTKSEILALRVATENLQRPLQCASYEKLVYFGSDNQQIPRNTPNRSHHSSPQVHGGSNPDRRKQSGSNNSPNHSGHPNDVHKRHPSSRGPKKPVPPMPKKVISDPLEQMSREAVAILNKITPQTFIKLTGKLSEIPIQNSSMLQKLVRLVFDKAVSEPNFANLYAEMCSILDASNNYTNFCHIVFNRDTNQYFWLKDIQYSNVVAGPYPSVVDCIAACVSDVPPPTQLISHPVSVAEEIVLNNHLISVFKTTDLEEYFGSFVPYSGIDRSLISETYFSSQDAATKSLMKKYGFNKMLVKICQDEYLDSIANRGYYGSPSLRRSKLEGMQLTPDELSQELAEIEELEGFVKRRMMGNIRFIGELCKKSIIKTATMHECIHELLFAKAIDEQELELVCKLLRTVGEKLEQSPNEDQLRALDSYFTKLSDLSKDTKINIRIRFSIEEIISLRQNNWQERRAADGPALIEEIRSKAANEELVKRQQQAQANSRHPGPRGRGHPGRGNPQEGRGSQSRIVSERSNQRRPSIPPSPELRPRANSMESPASVKTSVEIQERPQLSDEAIQRRVKSIVEEYLNLKDLSEVSECLVELPDCACGQLISFILGKYVDSKPDIQRDLLTLVKAVMPQLSAAREFVESSVSTAEPLVFLVDSMSDIKQAPELLGTVIAELINGQACRQQVIENVLDQIRKQNLSDEFGLPDGEFVGIQNRMLSVILARR